jgi:hypothetical protein
MVELSIKSTLAKTSAGRDAFARKDPTFDAKARMLFVMADGKRPVSELLAVVQDPTKGLTILSNLIEAGFLAQVMATKSTPDTQGLVVRVQLVSHWLNDHLGPRAEPLCLMLEAATDTADLEKRIAKCAIAVEFESARLGKEFRSLFLAVS